MKIWFRILIFLTILLTSLILLYFPYTELRNRSVKKLEDNQFLIAKQAAIGIENVFVQHRIMLKNYADSPDFIDFNANAVMAVKRDFRSYSKAIKAITRYDENGIIIYSYPEPEKVTGKDISAQPHVKKVIEDHKPNVSDVFTALQSYKAVSVAEPVFRNNRFAGAVAFLIDFEYVAKSFLTHISTEQTGYAWMIDMHGSDIYSPEEGHGGQSLSLSIKNSRGLTEITDQMKEGKSGTAVYVLKDVDGKESIRHVAFVSVDILNNFWSLAIESSEKGIVAELFSFYKKLLIAVVLLILSAGILLFISMKDFGLKKINQRLEARVNEEMEKRKEQDRIMFQQARFYSMGETMSAIAHQWRQPLNAVGLCIQDMEDAYRLGQMDEQYLTSQIEMAMKNLEKLSETIDEFSVFFQPNKEVQKVNICTELFNVYSIIRVQYDAMGISVQLLVDGVRLKDADGPPHEKYTVNTYPDLLKQVVLSCLQNSKEAIVKNIRKGVIVKGDITLAMEKRGETIIVEIFDNGGGIEEENMDRVFDPYYTTKNIEVGKGLGLYMSRNLMKEHLSGELNIENTEEGCRVRLSFKPL